MSTGGKQFAAALSQALLRAKAHTGRNIGALEDELGLTLNRRGGMHYIQWLKKGNLPAEISDVEILVTELWRLGGLNRALCQRLLHCAAHPAPQRLLAQFNFAEANDMGASEQATGDLVNSLDDVFVAGPPILKPAQFFGRQRELKRILGWWKRAPLSHVALIGPRRSGKTSVVNFLQRITQPPVALRPDQQQDWLPNPAPYHCVRVDFQDARMCKLDSLLRHLLSQLGLPIPTPCNLERFLDVMTDAQHWQHPIVILMDDIDRGLISPELSKAFWQSLRALVDSAVAGQLAFLVTSQSDLARLADQQSKTSTFFTIFNTLPLGAFTQAEARELIAHTPIPFSPADVDWILAQSQCQPQAVQILCQERLAALEEDRATAEADAWRREGVQRIASQAHPPTPHNPE